AKSTNRVYAPYKGVRTNNYVYIRYYSDINSLYNCDIIYLCTSGQEELYNIKKDPYQKSNLIPSIKRNTYNSKWRKTNKNLLKDYKNLQAKTTQLEFCSGWECSQ